MKDFVALFDSGIGGLSVLKDVASVLNEENIVYLADTLNCPYGIKTPEEVRKITLNNIEYLKNMGAKAIIIACNTATSTVISDIDKSKGYLIGVIKPTADAAYKISKTKRIGLFATNLTVNSRIYDTYLKDATVLSEGCSDFVPMIEAGVTDSALLRNSVKKHLKEVEGIDTLILGCTHFPFIEKVIKEESNIENIISSGNPTVKVLRKYLEDNNKLSNQNKRQIVFLTTGNINNVKKQIERFNFSFDEVRQVEI